MQPQDAEPGGTPHGANPPVSDDVPFADLLEHSGEGVIVFDPAFRYAYVNAEAERLIGYARVDLLGRVAWDIFPEALGTDFDRHYHHAMRERVPITFEAVSKLLGLAFEVRCIPIGGAVGGLAVLFRDVAERRAAEAARAAHQEALTLLSRVSDSFIALDAAWRITYINASAARQAGEQALDLLGAQILEKWPIVRGTRIEEELRRSVVGQEAVRFEHHFEGIDYTIEVEAVPAPASGLYVVFRNVTERKRLAVEREALLERQRRVVETIQRSLLVAPHASDFTGLEVARVYESAADDV
jgi:PAS domain S-box-containing protein